MFIRFVEIYEGNSGFDGQKQGTQFFTREIYINKSQVVSFKEDLSMIDRFIQNKIRSHFDNENQKFTLITLNKGNMGQDISVVGSVEYVYKLLEHFNVNKTQ